MCHISYFINFYNEWRNEPILGLQLNQQFKKVVTFFHFKYLIIIDSRYDLYVWLVGQRFCKTPSVAK